MSKPEVINAEELGHALGLIVHDLRNPAATITANVDFLQEVGLSDTDSNEALDDLKLAVRELRRGLDMVAWISRWMTGQVALEAASGDAGVFLQRLEREDTPVPVEVQIDSSGQLYAHGAQVAVEVASLLLHNTAANVLDPVAKIRVFESDARVVIEVEDGGRGCCRRASGPCLQLGWPEIIEGSLGRPLQPFRRVVRGGRRPRRRRRHNRSGRRKRRGGLQDSSSSGPSDATPDVLEGSPKGV